ncbi:MAG TPA: KH domain-containing protein [bacterium]
MSYLKDFVEQMAKAVVDSPEAVKVQEVEGEQTSILELRVAKEDIGKVIGKEGKTAKAMRTILGAASQKMKKKIHLEIME